MCVARGRLSGATLALVVLLGLGAASSSSTSALAEVRVYPDKSNWWTGYVWYRPSYPPPNTYGRQDGIVCFQGSNGSPSRVEWRGWMKFNLSSIPDGATILAASCSYYCYSAENTPLLFLTHLTQDPMFRTPEEVFGLVGAGTRVIDESIPHPGTGWYLNRPLNPAGLAAIQAGLASDWVALGFLELDHPGIPSRYGIALGGKSQNYEPYLTVTYTTEPQLPGVRVDTPNGGENWVIGTNRTIVCTHYGGAAVTDSVLISRNGGTDWEFLFKEPAANTHDWIVTGPATAQARIRVVAINAVGTGADDSDADFTISSALQKPTVLLVSPNGGETWTIGTEQIVSCVHTGGDADYDSLLVSRNSGADWEFLFKAAAANAHHWTVSGPATTQARIRIVAVNAVGQGYDDSNGDFTIADPVQAPEVRVLVPNGGEAWVIGEQQVIECEHTGGPAVTDSVLISRNGGLDWEFLFKEPAANTHDWTVTGPTTAQARIRVVAIAASGETGRDDSDDDFSIVSELEPPTVTLIQPNGGQYLVVGETYQIRWSHGGGMPVTNSVWYSTNNGADWLPIELGITPPVTEYDWEVPNTPTTQGRVRVQAANRAGSGEAVSRDPFEIGTSPQPPQVEVLIPNGGETWVVGTEQTISCRHTGGTAVTDSILLSVDAGATWLFLMKVPAAENHRWTVVPIPTTRARIRIVAISASGETGSDDSDRNFSIVLDPSWPYGWHEVRSLPELPSGKPAKDGAWLVTGPAPYSIKFAAGCEVQVGSCLYVTKGYKTGDFYLYEPFGNTYVPLETIPSDEQGRIKLLSKGSCGASDQIRFVYLVKGNNTLGFWQYDTERDSWSRLPDVPAGPDRKKVKGGSDLVYVRKADTGFIYLLKGYRTEFYRYNVNSRVWDTLQAVPYGTRPKYDKGSFLVHDGAGRLYVHQAKYFNPQNGCHYMFCYDTRVESWQPTQLKGLPLSGLHSGRVRNKKSKDGAAGAWYQGRLYALKGGNTQQFFCYTPQADSWRELDTIPSNGTTGGKKFVKAGGDLVYFGYGAFFALKGNKTRELWRYRQPPSAAGLWLAIDRPGVQADSSAVGGPQFTVWPNPVGNGWAALMLSGHLARQTRCLVRIYDTAGRCVLVRPLAIGDGPLGIPLDLRSLSTGVYLIRFDADGLTQTRKLVVQR
ncbi:MAG: T9SS type A sorting domain-containing protein [candidate division WOR-3 bacterium]